MKDLMDIRDTDKWIQSWMDWLKSITEALN